MRYTNLVMKTYACEKCNECKENNAGTKGKPWCNFMGAMSLNLVLGIVKKECLSDFKCPALKEKSK